MTEQTITDERLTAYLDGELAPQEAAAIEAALQSSAQLQARLAALDVPIPALRQGFDALLNQAPRPPALPKAPRQSTRPWLAAVAASALLGVGLGGFLFKPTPQTWTQAVANYQSLYVTETLSAPPMETALQDIVIASLSGRLGVDLTPLTNLDGIDFRRAQMLGIDGAPLVQMAYLADGTIPVAICITPRDAEDSATELTRMFGMEAASWTADGHGVLIIGGDDPALIENLAQAVRAAI